MSKLNQTVHHKIGAIIREAREKKDLTQLELGHILGFSNSMFIHLIESGKSKVPMRVLGTLIILLNLPEKRLTDLLLKDYEEKLRTKIAEGRFSNKVTIGIGSQPQRLK